MLRFRVRFSQIEDLDVALPRSLFEREAIQRASALSRKGVGMDQGRRRFLIFSLALMRP
jgi:hypothetical protein